MTVKNPIFILYNDCCTVLDMVDGKIVKKGVLDRNDLITWLTSLQQAKKTTTLKEFRKIPPNCVFHGYYTDDTGVMVLEQQPCVVDVMVDMSGAKNSKDVYPWKIKLPWVYYIFKYNWIESSLMIKNTSVFAATEALQTPNSLLSHLPVPNLNQSGVVCFGQAVDSKGNKDLVDAGRRVPVMFWGSTFNNDYWYYDKLNFADFQEEHKVFATFISDASKDGVLDLSTMLKPGHLELRKLI